MDVCVCVCGGGFVVYEGANIGRTAPVTDLNRAQHRIPRTNQNPISIRTILPVWSTSHGVWRLAGLSVRDKLVWSNVMSKLLLLPLFRTERCVQGGGHLLRVQPKPLLAVVPPQHLNGHMHSTITAQLHHSTVTAQSQHSHSTVAARRGVHLNGPRESGTRHRIGNTSQHAHRRNRACR